MCRGWPEPRCIYTVFLAGNSPNIRSYTVYICSSGQPYNCGVMWIARCKEVVFAPPSSHDLSSCTFSPLKANSYFKVQRAVATVARSERHPCFLNTQVMWPSNQATYWTLLGSTKELHYWASFGEHLVSCCMPNNVHRPAQTLVKIGNNIILFFEQLVA